MTFTIFGGRLMPQLDLTLSGKLPVSDEVVRAQEIHTKSLGLKTYREAKALYHKLAVVGGGTSINDHVETLRNWDGDIWAINGAYGWCQERGIDACFFAGDPDPITTKWDVGVKRALIEQCAPPATFEALRQSGADVYTFDTGHEAGCIRTVGSTASAAPHLAVRMGYRHVTFFGCESCYVMGATHAYQDEDRDCQMIVECGGNHYLTADDFYMYAKSLAEYINEVPEYLSEQSGGLLRAMVENKCQHRIVWVSQAMAKGMTPVRRADPPANEPYLPLNWDG